MQVPNGPGGPIDGGSNGPMEDVQPTDPVCYADIKSLENSGQNGYAAAVKSQLDGAPSAPTGFNGKNSRSTTPKPDGSTTSKPPGSSDPEPKSIIEPAMAAALAATQTASQTDSRDEEDIRPPVPPRVGSSQQGYGPGSTGYSYKPNSYQEQLSKSGSSIPGVKYVNKNGTTTTYGANGLPQFRSVKEQEAYMRAVQAQKQADAKAKVARYGEPTYAGDDELYKNAQWVETADGRVIAIPPDNRQPEEETLLTKGYRYITGTKSPDAQLQKLEREVVSLRKKETKMLADLQDLRYQNGDLASKNRQLKNKHLEYEEEISKMSQQQDAQLSELHGNLQYMQNNIDSYSSVLAKERDDDYWKPILERLYNKIQTWAMGVAESFPKVMAAAAENSVISTETEDELLTVYCVQNAMFKDLLASLNNKGKKKRRFLLQGWVHLVLSQRVFTSNIPPQNSREVRPTGADIWLPKKTSDVLQAMESEMAVLMAKATKDDRAFHKWRTLTLSLLQKTNPEALIHGDFLIFIDRKCRDMGEVIAELSGGALKAEDIAKDIMDIVEEATAISAQLRTQKGAFEMRFPDAGPGRSLKFDSTWMVVDRDERPTVDFVIEPAIFKAGNGQGQNYHKIGPFVKAKVACFKPSSSERTAVI